MDKGSVPLVPNEDGPAIKATTTPAAGRNGGTYNTPSKCTFHITISAMLIPYKLEDTSATSNYDSGPVNGRSLSEAILAGVHRWRPPLAG
jgi:hypothetical protein